MRQWVPVPVGEGVASGACNAYSRGGVIGYTLGGMQPVNFRWRVGTSGAAGLVLAVAVAGTSLGAVDVVELSAQQVVPGSMVTLRVATTATEVRGESGSLFMIPSGTFGDSPESLRCEQVGRAVEVAQIHWTAGPVEYEGESYAGVTGEVTFTVPQLAVDTYRLAESLDNDFTGCHVFALIHVVSDLPDTALPSIGPVSVAGQGLPAGVGLLVIAFVLAHLRVRALGQT